MAYSIETLPNGLKLQQDDAFFKLGQDSMLLSAFAKPRRFSKVLDLGSGVGALSLLLWRPDLQITGLELQAGAVELFRQSIADNALENVTALQGDLRKMRALLPHSSMDYVICNPPYFKANAGKTAQNSAHATARADLEATIQEIVVAASYVLHTGGKCAMVFRPERLLTLCAALDRVRLTPKRLRMVHQTPVAAPSAVLIECRKGSQPDGLSVEPPLIVESDEVKKIYGML